jgi:hypothetical protein
VKNFFHSFIIKIIHFFFVFCVEMSLPECCICLDEINKNPVVCPYCRNTAHTACTKQHLLNEQQEPICYHPDCLKYWSREVIDAMPLPKSWVGKELREHRANVLYERERAMFPSTAERVTTRQNLDLLQNELQRLRTHLDNAQSNEWFLEAVQQRNAVTKEHAEECLRLSELCGLRERLKFLTNCLRSMEVGQRVAEGRDTSAVTQRAIDAHEQNYIFRSSAAAARIETKADDGTEEKKPKVLFGCPANGCNGFVGSYNNKCLICDVLVCKYCHEIISPTKDVEPQDVQSAIESHVCDAGTLATLTLVASDSKKCPNCCVSIMRTEGCPVMLCTKCGTFFSWTTLKRLQGRQHNPHYEEYQRMRNGGLANNQNESERMAPVCVVQLPTKDGFIARLNRLGLPSDCLLQLGVIGVRILDLVRHIQNEEIVPEPNPQEVNLVQRLALIRNEMTTERFKQLVHQNDKRLSLKRERNQVWEMFCAEISVGMHTNVINTDTSNMARAVEFLTSIEGLIAYVNKAMTTIGKRYNHLPMLILRTLSDKYHLHTGLPQSYIYEVRKIVTSNLGEPGKVVHISETAPGGAITNFVPTLESIIYPAPIVVPTRPPATASSHSDLFLQPQKRKNIDSDSD